ncbi:hypothetical protein WJX75_004215 [Coccomyxa subellipsoidea]|uniref:F-box domain-containing protein n=1 Tax=Coccomyxa subellipsoidea TaxID=248742 RepID=A0ABR2YC53_9CHLO
MGKRALIVHPDFLHTLPQQTPFRCPARLGSLPLHIVHLVACKFDNARDLCTFEQVCTFSREAVQSDDSLWQNLCCSKFRMPRHADLSGKEGLTWKALYR